MEQSKSKIIDKLDDVENRENLTLEDLDIQYRTGRAIVSGTGRDRKVSYRTGYACTIGDVKDTVWMKLAEETVERILSADFLERTEAFVRRTGLPTERRSSTSVHQAALEICTAQLWKSSKWISKKEHHRDPSQVFTLEAGIIVLVCSSVLVRAPNALAEGKRR